MTRKPTEVFSIQNYFIFSYSEGEGRGGSTRTIPLIKVEKDLDHKEQGQILGLGFIKKDLRIGAIRMSFIIKMMYC